jgi:hypothetical protein
MHNAALLGEAAKDALNDTGELCALGRQGFILEKILKPRRELASFTVGNIEEVHHVTVATPCRTKTEERGVRHFNTARSKGS